MTNFNSDLIAGAALMTGIFCFVSGEFILSTVIFASLSVYFNIGINHAPKQPGKKLPLNIS